MESLFRSMQDLRQGMAQPVGQHSFENHHQDQGSGHPPEGPDENAGDRARQPVPEPASAALAEPCGSGPPPSASGPRDGPRLWHLPPVPPGLQRDRVAGGVQPPQAAVPGSDREVKAPAAIAPAFPLPCECAPPRAIRTNHPGGTSRGRRHRHDEGRRSALRFVRCPATGQPSGPVPCDSRRQHVAPGRERAGPSNDKP